MPGSTLRVGFPRFRSVECARATCRRSATSWSRPSAISSSASWARGRARRSAAPSTSTTAGSWSRGAASSPRKTAPRSWAPRSRSPGARVGILGPVAVLTNYHNQTIGQQLIRAAQDFFDENKATLHGCVTYPTSPKHLYLYHKFGYRPKQLTAIMSRAIDRGPARGSALAKAAGKTPLTARRFSTLEEAKKKAALARIHRITNAICRGHGPLEGDRDRRRPGARRHAAARARPRPHRLRDLSHARRERGAGRAPCT